ncbi:baeRF11 domain-containing protein [Yersinia aldovae]|uniref:baeRF11 domain-containing protein n=1 Tax=Yersinia aldovae TaxID=29483 RepID=UPI00119E0630|nr:hypothetical protein [Yersinia aldovae]
MLYVDIPSREEFLLLSDARADACVSIYIETSPRHQELTASKIQMGNFIKDALRQLQAIDFDKRRLAQIEVELNSILDDASFWDMHAYSLAIFANPDSIRTYRLANAIPNQLHVSDRFYVKPLLRALTFPHSAYILALSENQARVIEFFADVPAAEMAVANLPTSVLDAVGKASLNVQKHGGVDDKIRLAQYTRQIDHALRPIFVQRDCPLILVSTEPLASIYRSTNTLPHLVDETLFTNAEHIGISELVTMARPFMERYYQSQIAALKPLFETRAGQRRVTTDLSDAARLATQGAIDLLLVDMDSVVAGIVDEQGSITFTEQDDALSYGVIDEIARRALATGAQVMAVRQNDLPKGQHLNAILRYPL